MASARSSRSLRRAAGIAAGIGLAGIAGFGYSAVVEPRMFRVRRHTLPLLPPGSDPVRILHLSDMHLAGNQGYRSRFVRSLAELEPDLVVNTGDNFGGDTLPLVLEALDPLLDVPGVFVLGSNDVWGPTFKNPARYLTRRTTQGEDKSKEPTLPVDELRASFEARGWSHLDNCTSSLTVGDTALAFAGLGDAHMNADRVTDTHPRFPSGHVRIGVTHAPYSRTLEAFAGAGADLVLAGHTHGGQIRVPFWGAPVTNCDLDRTRARGLFSYRRSRVHVSAGLGYSPYSPVRFACPPEVSLLMLVGRPGSD
ncbi:metallophosphoesterase [Brevibacterium jeotgali]|uniref:Predicted phosphohydrolase, MPP superfamily n=1 Tax=Brevibacterium jeotgali TaxID=1262550 RepID=A0A2H1L199_9MICO|nr:metallophosphoesterase [Brevibacterium jeotgali]TWC02007.1 putative MPP superfamily phosphohydrolase [Brevibacterium jeotgali]SMY10642.1 Predicted phosphohydrolase, MPP superfamily [Brevibacterium jeotgali]